MAEFILLKRMQYNMTLELAFKDIFLTSNWSSSLIDNLKDDQSYNNLYILLLIEEAPFCKKSKKKIHEVEDN